MFEMPKQLFINSKIVLSEKVLTDYGVLCCEGKIVKIDRAKAFTHINDADIIDGQGMYLTPGFIDLHIHGIRRHLIDNGPEALAAICDILPETGVTSFLPTVMPLPPGEDIRFLNTLANVKTSGAAILGFHLEGPFLSLKGALPENAFHGADAKRALSLMEAMSPYRAIFSISPEVTRIADIIKIMIRESAGVFITHTAATVKQTQAAIDAGATHATHFYDVFPCPPVTEPGARPCGAVEAIMANPQVSVDFILDGIHVDPIAVKMALACKPTDKVALITDANIGSDLPPGRYTFHKGHEVEFEYDGSPARFTADSPHPGAVAGSGLTMDKVLKNAMKFINLELPQAVRLVSTNPAGILGLNHCKGHIKEGYDADLVLLDNSYNVVQTWIADQCCYTKQS
jgi:N-acetylglucosamine-6-phosphate deacetylase